MTTLRNKIIILNNSAASDNTPSNAVFRIRNGVKQYAVSPSRNNAIAVKRII